MTAAGVDLSLGQWAALSLIYILAFGIKGLFGYGAVPALIVLGSLVVPPHHAVLLAALSNLITHVQFMSEGWRNGDRRLALSLGVFFLPTVLLGIWIFASLKSDGLSIIAGCLMFAVLLLEMSGALQRLGPTISNNRYLAGPVVASICGVVSGVIGAGAITLLAVYIRLCTSDKKTFRATVLLAAAIIIVWRCMVLLVTGAFDSILVLQACILAPLGLLGGYLGTAFANRLSNQNFFAFYRLLLLAGAVGLFARGLS